MMLNGGEERVLSLLQLFGLTKYQSKVYFTLLLIQNGKGGELARKSGVPQSKIYEVILELAEKELVRVSDEFPKRIEAVPLSYLTKKTLRIKLREIVAVKKSAVKVANIINKLQPAFQNNGRYLRVFQAKYKRVGVHALTF